MAIATHGTGGRGRNAGFHAPIVQLADGRLMSIVKRDGDEQAVARELRAVRSLEGQASLRRIRAKL